MIRIRYVPCSTITGRHPFEYLVEWDVWEYEWAEIREWLDENQIPHKARSPFQIYMNKESAVIFSLRWA